MKKNIIIILFLIASTILAQEKYTHEPTGLYFYETTLYQSLYIESLEIDDIEGVLAEYSLGYQPTGGDVEQMLSPLNPGDADAIFIFYSDDQWLTEDCVGWTYFGRNENDLTGLRIYGNDGSTAESEVSNYPSNGAVGNMFRFKVYDANANAFGEVDLLSQTDGHVSQNIPLDQFFYASNNVDGLKLEAQNIFGCEDEDAFNENLDATAPCALSDEEDCLDCGYEVSELILEAYVGNMIVDGNEPVYCDSTEHPLYNSESGNDITLTWETPTTNPIVTSDPNFQWIYRIVVEFEGAPAGAIEVVDVNSYVIEGDNYDVSIWGLPVEVYVYAWNGYNEIQNLYMSYSGGENYDQNQIQLQLCDEPLPNPPSNLIPVAGEGQVLLTWNRPDNDHTQSYNLYRNGDEDNPINIVSEEYLDDGLESDRKYTYYVKAVNSGGVEGDPSQIIEVTTDPMNQVQDYYLRVGLQSIELNWEHPIPYSGDSYYNYTIYKWPSNIADPENQCEPENPPCEEENITGYCNNNLDILNQEECEDTGRKWIYDKQCVSYTYYFENVILEDETTTSHVEAFWFDSNGDKVFQLDEEVSEYFNCSEPNPQSPMGITQNRLVIDDNLDDSQYYCFSVVAEHSQGKSEHSKIICGKPQPLFNWQIDIDVELEVSNTYSVYDTSNIIGSSGGNGMWDPNENYTDVNFNGIYDEGDIFDIDEHDIGATDGYDPRFDLPEPMTPPNQWVQLYFPHENEGMWQNSFNLNKFTQDIRELEYYQSNPRTWLGHIVTDSPGELKISFDIKTEINEDNPNGNEDTLKFFTFIRGDFVDDPIMVLDKLVIDGHSGVHMSNGTCPLTLSGTENELCNETIEELFVQPMDTVQFAITVGYKPPQARQGLEAIGDYRQITVFWDEPDECCSTDDGIFPPENYDIFRNMSIFGEDTTNSMIMDGLEQEYYVDLGADISVNDDWFTNNEIVVFGYPDDPRRLLDETEYFYTVRGNNVAGSGPYTTQTSAITGDNRSPVAIISQSNGLGLDGNIIAEDVDTVFTQIPHNGLGDLNPIYIFLDGSLSEDLDLPKDDIAFDWNLLDGNASIDFDNSESEFIEITLRNQYDTDTNYYHLELIVTDTYYRGVWDDGEMNILQDHNIVKDTVVIVVAPELNQEPVARIMIDYGDYLEDGFIANSINNSEQEFDIVPQEFYSYLSIDQEVLEYQPFIWIPPHDGDPNTDWASIGLRGFGENIIDVNENGYMDLDENNQEFEDWDDLDMNGSWTYASKDADDYPNTSLAYWGIEGSTAPSGGLHDTLYFDWLIGQNPETIIFDSEPLGEYNEGDIYVDANNNGFWDAGDPYTFQNLEIYRQPGIYDISLVVRDDYYYRDTASFKIHVLPEFNQMPNVRLGNFYNDRLSYHLPEGEQTFFIQFPLDTSGCVSWYNNSASPEIYANCGYPYGTIVSEPFNDNDGDGVFSDGDQFLPEHDLFPNGRRDVALTTLYDSDNIVENNGFYDTLLVHEISDNDFWTNNDEEVVYDQLQHRWYVDGILRGEEAEFGYDLDIGTHEIVIEVIDPYGNFETEKTTDTITVYISMEPPPAPVIASQAELTEDLYYVELNWMESEFNNDNDVSGIEADNWPFGFPQIAENAHIATEYKIFRKRPNAQNPIETIYMEVATLSIDEEDDYFYSYAPNESSRKQFTYIDNGLYPGEEYCYQIKPANSHGQLAGSMICGETCDQEDADNQTELCVETVEQFQIELSNFIKPHIINSLEYDSIGYKIGNEELQTDNADNSINDIDLCDVFDGIWNPVDQSCELDPRPFLDRIEVAYQSNQMNGHSDWVDLPAFLYEYIVASNSYVTYLDMNNNLSIEYIEDKLMPNGDIGYIINDNEGYVQLYANDGDLSNDYLYSEYLEDSNGNFGTNVYNDDIYFRFRLYDHGDFDGQNCSSILDIDSCYSNPSCKWIEEESICDNYFFEVSTLSPLIMTSNTLIHPLWTVDSDPFENNVGAAGAKFMFGLPLNIEENILLNESFLANFIDSEILEGEFNDEWLITDDLGTSGNLLLTGQANILWLQYHNLFKVTGQTLKNKSISITEGWNLLTNPLVAKIHKTSLQFISGETMQEIISWQEAKEAGIVSSSLNTWNAEENRYDDVEILEPFNGYWIHIGDLNNDGEITQNGIDNNHRYYVYYEPSKMPTLEEISALDVIDWKLRLNMKPRRSDGALSNQYGGDYIEVGVGDPSIFNNDFKFGEDEYNLKTFPTLTYPGDLFIQRADWADSQLAPDNLRFYKDFRAIQYNWNEINISSGCSQEFAQQSQESCESAGECFWLNDVQECEYKYDGAYVWELTSIIGNASNVSENTTDDWIVKFEWNIQDANDALINIPNLPEDDPETVNTDESAKIHLHYVKVLDSESGIDDEYQYNTIKVPMNMYPLQEIDANGNLTPIEGECITSDPTDQNLVCIDIPYSDMLKLDNMGIDDEYTWNVRIALGKEVKSDTQFLGEEESVTDLGLPKQFNFGDAYPNPFNPTTTFDFALPEASDVTIEVYNVLGQKVLVLLDNQFISAGYHQVILDGADLSSGVYIVTAQLGSNYRKVNKVILFK